MTEADIAEVLELDRKIFSTPWSEDNFESAVSLSYYSSMVVVENNEICGFVVCRQLFESADLDIIAVASEQRKKGLGRLLLEKEIELLCENECEKLFLEVRESNEVALKFYEGMGFTQIDVRKDYYDKPVENAFIMVKEL